MATYAPLPYYVLADVDRKGRVLGYRVCFDADGHVEVEDGYFPLRGTNWQIALVGANALRDELNTAETGSAVHPMLRD